MAKQLPGQQGFDLRWTAPFSSIASSTYLMMDGTPSTNLVIDGHVERTEMSLDRARNLQHSFI